MKPDKIIQGMKFYNCDCMELMKETPDNYYSLCIVDPPYGLGKRTTDGGSKKNTQTKFMSDMRRFAEIGKELDDKVAKNQVVIKDEKVSS